MSVGLKQTFEQLVQTKPLLERAVTYPSGMHPRLVPYVQMKLATTSLKPIPRSSRPLAYPKIGKAQIIEVSPEEKKSNFSELFNLVIRSPY